MWLRRLDVSGKDVVLGESEEARKEEGEGEDGDALSVEGCGDVSWMGMQDGGFGFGGREGGEGDSDGDDEYREDLFEGISEKDMGSLEGQGMGETHRFLTRSQPRSMLMIIPPLRKTIWTDIGMSYANAALLRTESTKKSAT